jgi:purine-nucleoside phosphorylase
MSPDKVGEKMDSFRRQVEEAASFIRSRVLDLPRIGMILGTGLGGVVSDFSESTVVPYGEIPHYPLSTVLSHHGQLVCGKWAGKPILVMQGRFHLYEGYSPAQVSFPIRVMQALGVKMLILSNAAGGLNPHFRSGELMLVTDHINFTGQNPLVGSNIDEWGPRFPDMTEPYSKRLQKIAVDAAISERILLHRGVYIGVLGPSMETAAETRFFRAVGADAIGMSMVMEAITAVHSGMEVLGISAISNVNLPDYYLPADLDQIIQNAQEAGEKLSPLLKKILEGLD